MTATLACIILVLIAALAFGWMYFCIASIEMRLRRIIEELERHQ